MFGKSPKSAPDGALPNRWAHSSSIPEAAREVIFGFYLGGGVMKKNSKHNPV